MEKDKYYTPDISEISDAMESFEHKEMDKYYFYHYREAEKIIRNVKGKYSIETASIILSAMLAILKNE